MRSCNQFNLGIYDEIIIEGGVESIRLSLIPELAKLTHSIIWMLPENKISYFKSQIDDSLPIKIISNTFPSSSFAAKISVLVFKLLKGHFKDYIESSYKNIYLKLVCKKYKISSILTTCIYGQKFPSCSVPISGIICDLNLDPYKKESMMKSIKNWIKNCNYIFSISKVTTKQILKEFKEIEHIANRVQTIPLSYSDQLNLNSRRRSKEDFITFFYPASFNPNKGHLALLKVVINMLEEKNLADFQVILSGNGTEKIISDKTLDNTRLEETRRFGWKNRYKLKDKLIIKGFVNALQLSSLYSSSDYIVLPSLKEGFGLPLSEGLYYGLPIIAFDLESYQEQVNLYRADDRITFVPLNSISDLQNEMRKAIRFPKEKESISQIKKRTSNWTWSDVAGTYCDYILRENGVKN